MENHVQSSRRLVLVPLPLQGHVTPMLQLGTILQARGFSITVVHTHYNFPNTSRHPDFTFLRIPDGLSGRNVLSEGLINFTSILSNNCKKPLQELLVQMIQRGGPGEKLPCVIYDGLMYFAEIVADDLKIPSIVLRTSSAANLQVYYELPGLSAEGHVPWKDSAALDLVPGLQPLRFKDLPTYSFGVEHLSRLAARLIDTRSSSAVVLNTMNCLEEPSLVHIREQCKVPIFQIGAMHKLAAASTSLLEEEASCMSWLDKQAHNSVIYISMGSVASVNENELTEIAWGLANSEQPFLWVIRPSLLSGSDMIKLLPEGSRESVGRRGYILKWAPQKQVLAHPSVGGFWSHCGWNSTLESICEGVPMICQPRFGDRKITAMYVSHIWRVGLELEQDLPREEIEIAVRKLMLDKEGEEMSERAVKLKKKSKLEMKQGGSSHCCLNELVHFLTSC